MRKASDTSPAGTPDTIRILIADSQPALRRVLRERLEAGPVSAVPLAGRSPTVEVVGEAGDGVEAIRLATELQADVLVVDGGLADAAGLEAVRETAKAGVPWRTLLLTAAIDRPGIVQALQLGAHGIILKDAPKELVFAAIRGVMAGGYWIGHERVPDLIGYLRDHSPQAGLSKPPSWDFTARERQVISAIVAGYTSREIAQRLGLSEEAVGLELSTIFGKTGVSHRLELALFAIHHQLIP